MISPGAEILTLEIIQPEIFPAFIHQLTGSSSDMLELIKRIKNGKSIAMWFVCIVYDAFKLQWSLKKLSFENQHRQ